jgi:hypothetical protein
VSDEIGHVAPGFEPRQRLASDQVPHNVGISTELVVFLKIAEPIHAENETLGLMRDVVHCERSPWPRNEEIP